MQDPTTFSTDLLNLVLPTRYQLIAPNAATRVSREFSGFSHEATGYLGLPLLVLLVVAAVRLWDDLRVRVTSVTGGVDAPAVAGAVAAHRQRAVLRIPLPWLALGKLPLLKHVLPGRLTVFVWLAVAVVVAIVIARATRLAPRPAARWLLAVGTSLILLLPAPLRPGAVHHTGLLPELAEPPHQVRRNGARRTIFRQWRRGRSDGVGRRGRLRPTDARGLRLRAATQRRNLFRAGAIAAHLHHVRDSTARRLAGGARRRSGRRSPPTSKTPTYATSSSDPLSTGSR